MEQEVNSYSYNPSHPISQPFTIISSLKGKLISKPINQPFFYEVYCPLSCKKIKIGYSKDKNSEIVQFNTTTGRVVRAYLQENLRYLINNHRPVKKQKQNKKIEGNGWRIDIDVQDKGNIAIFNPYCVDPENPLTQYIFDKLQKIQKPLQQWEFKPLQINHLLKLKTKGKIIFTNQSFQWLSFNSFLDQESSKQVVLLNPNNKKEGQKFITKEIHCQFMKNLYYWLHQLQMTIDMQNNQSISESIDNVEVEYNLDIIYQKLSFTLNLLQQLRARLMNDTCHQIYQQLFKFHPRIYSAFERLKSFFNYGNTKYDTKKLAQQGFFNKSDMLQNISYYEFPNTEIPTAEEDNIKNQKDLRKQMFPFCRTVRNLPFPNVDIETFTQSLHSQKLHDKNQKITAQFCSDKSHFMLFVNSNGIISVWNTEMYLYKMFQFKFTEVKLKLKKQQKKIPNSEKAHQQILNAFDEEGYIEDLFNDIPQTLGMPAPAIEPAEIKPDPALLQQIIVMGYGPSTVSKALIRVKNQSVVAALDAIQQIQNEQKLKLKDKFLKKQWICSSCTFKNQAGSQICQICGQICSSVTEEEENLQKILQEQLRVQQQRKKQEQDRQKKQKEELQRKQKQERQLKQKQEEQRAQKLKNSKILSVQLIQLKTSPINPFLVCLLLQTIDGQIQLRTYRIGINRLYLLKFMRFQGNNMVSNLTRKVYSKPTYDEISEVVRESSANIYWGAKLFQKPTNNDWFIIQQQTLTIEKKSVNRIEADDNLINLLENNTVLASYKIQIEDDLNEQTFRLVQEGKPLQLKQNASQQDKTQENTDEIQIVSENNFQIEGNVQQISFEILQHVPKGVWKQKQINQSLASKIPIGLYNDTLVMSEFIPLQIQNYEGSLFSSKYSSTSLLTKSTDTPFTSNYPTVSFAFKSIDNRPILAQSISIIANTNKIQKIYAVTGGLIFTADNFMWFEVAKSKFANMNKQKYDNWLKNKIHSSNPKPEFWQPVAYFEFTNQTEFQISYKRVAKYIFLLPTQYQQKGQRDEVAALKIDFFGVKGRVQNQDVKQNQIIEEYKKQGERVCKLQISRQRQNQWSIQKQQNYEISTGCNPNTFYFLPNFVPKSIPLSLLTVFTLKFKSLGNKKKVLVDSQYIKRVRILDKKYRNQQIQEKVIKSFPQLVSVHQKMSDYNLAEACTNLKIEQLILIILEGKSHLTQYENILMRLIKRTDYQQKMAQVIFRLLSQLCNENIIISQTGYRIFMRIFQQLSSNRQKIAKNAICQAWKNLVQFTSKCRNKNYNILRNQYKIENLVLQPALFSKDYYRLINPNYVQEEKTENIASEPQTPINCRLFVNNITNFNYVYYLDTIGHHNINKLELYFPKLAPGNKYKFVLKISQLHELQTSDIVQKQIFFRSFTQDLLIHLSANTYKGTQIFKKSLINYLSVPLQTKARFLKIYLDYAILTTHVHPRFKQFIEPYIAIPIICSDKVNTKINPIFSIQQLENSSLKRIFENFAVQAKHNSSQIKLPPYRYSSSSKNGYYVIHQFKNKFIEGEDKNQFSDIIEKITQNILDKNIVTASAKSLRINDYPLGYKGLDFVYTFMIGLMKILRKFPTETIVAPQMMFLLLENFVIYQQGPIMTITTTTLIQLYNRLNMAEKSFFIEQVISKYLESIPKNGSVKISQKYETEKITKFLSNFFLPHAKMFEIMASTQSIFLTSILIKLIINNIQNFNLGNLQIYKRFELVRKLQISQLEQITFAKCLWILDNVKNITAQILEIALDLLLILFPNTQKQEMDQDGKNTKSFIIFMKKLEEKDFWKLVFLTLKINNDALKDRIHKIFKVLIENMSEKFSKSINNMLLQIIIKDEGSLYHKINQNISNETRMTHLQTILQYLSMAKSSLFLDVSTSKSLLSLPLTPTLWSLAFKIIPRQDEILQEIIKHFNPQFYNSLSKQIMQFCSPLSGIRPIKSNYINWLELIREIKIEKKSIFEIFIKNLENTSYGGALGLTMAPISDVKQLEVTNQFATLVNQNPLQEKYFTEYNVKVLVCWYFMNYSTLDGSSPATQLIKILSTNLTRIFENCIDLPNVLRKLIKASLQARKEGEIAEKLLQQKKIASNLALNLNKRFSQCFENLLSIFNINDQLHQYFTFEINGLNYILQKIGLESKDQAKLQYQVQQGSEEELLINQGIINNHSDSKNSQQASNTTVELKEQQFCNNVTLVPNQNPHTISSVATDWTTHKKGSKSKVIFLPMIDETYYQFPLTIQLNRIAEVRSIKMGFPAASYEFSDKLIASPSGIRVEGSVDMKCFEPIGELERIFDDGYISSGVAVYVLNLQKVRKSSNIDIKKSVQNFGCYRMKYLRIFVRRPVVSFVEGQFSPLCGKSYKTLGCNVNFLSISGDDIDKLPFRISSSCKQISKQSALMLLSSIINQQNPITTKKISNSENFINKIKQNFKSFKEQMKAYPNIVPQILYTIGSNNEDFGNWIIHKFLDQGEGQIQAKIMNKIIISTPHKIHQRLNIFLKYIFTKLNKIAQQNDIESGIIYTESVSFIESFCKTLEESYNIDTQGKTATVQYSLNNIQDIITIYDRKYSSSEIKSINKLLINILYIKSPLIPSEQLIQKSLSKIWEQCCQSKPHFFSLLASLLVNKRSSKWVCKDDHKLTKQLVDLIKQSVEKNSLKILGSQIYLLSVISSTSEKQYIRKNDIALNLYNLLKDLSFETYQIYKHFIKVIQNTVLQDSERETKLAKQLIEDVTLIAKRKDPILQKFYTSIIGLQPQSYVCLQNFSIEIPKKDMQIPTKILTNKNNLKFISNLLSKSIKFTLTIENDLSKQSTQNKTKSTLYSDLLSSMNSSQFLMILKIKLSNNKNGFFGCYHPGKAYRIQDQSYCWEDSMTYQKGSFVFMIHEGQNKIIQTTENNKTMVSLYGGEDQYDQFLIIYDNKGQQLMKMSCQPNSETYAKLPNSSQRLKIQSYEVFNGSIKSVSNSGSQKLNSMSTKAEIPYNMYRHSNVFSIPAKISVEKLLQILGVIGTCKFNHQIIDPSTKLSELQNETQDHIIDLDINTQNIDQNKDQIGMIPQMTIFKKFSEMKGIEQVLRVGTESVKQWNKADRKKNFEHYFQELKNFGRIPYFFELFIKNHNSVTFLLEVVSGLPDDPVSTRIWEQQEVTHSKFMYKIVSDVFKFNRTPQLRDMDVYTGFCQITLIKLAEISKQTVRKYVEDAQEEVQPQAQAPVIQKKKSEQPQKPKKKKGTGYGADSGGNSKWSANQWIQHRKNVNQQIQRIVCIFASFLDCQKPLNDPRIAQVLKNSCLLPLLENALRSGSLLDISKQAELFRNYLAIIKNLASNPGTIECILDIDKKYKPSQTQSIHSLLGKLHGISQIFLDCMKSGKQSESDVPAQIAFQINKLYQYVDKAVKSIFKKKNKITIKQIEKMPVSKSYRILLQNLRFGYVDMKQNNQFKHFYASTISSGSPATHKILRLSQQLADLSSSLPCQSTNSIFVRCDRSRIDVIKILIMGSSDTPYSNGAFCFDLYCDDNYPNLPPKMSITTTGSGKIRFNPNLYSCGKVCLSLLGTWRGQASENWDAKLSTLLQLFISTQGITMSQDVYFNQPGLEGEQGTTEGQKKNEGYSNIVRLGNVRYAMNGQLKNPTKGFQDVIKRHFYVKKKQILQQVQKWIRWAEKKQAAYTGLVNDHNMSWCSELKSSKTKYKQLLVKQYEQLKQNLNKLTPPDLQEKQQQVNFEEQKQKKKGKAKEVMLGQIDVSYDPIAEKQMAYEQDVIQDRWSRYVGAMGLEAVKKQSQSRVLLVGLKPLGLQIAKNLVLSGLKELTIIQNDTIFMGSEQHFYMSDFKGKKIEQCLFKIKQLNPYMVVRHQHSIPSDLSKFNIVVSTQSINQSLALSQQCHKSKIKFIYTQTAGVCGTFFADLGQDFSIHDTNGQQPFEGLIKNISCEENGIVTLLDGLKHTYEDGDYIVIDKIDGMEIIEQKIEQKTQAQLFYENLTKQKQTNSINGKVFKIKVINWNSFSIGDTTNFKPYIRNGICKGIKLPKKVQYKSFNESLQKFEQFLDPNMSIYDFDKIGDNFAVFACFRTYANFIQKYKHKPRNWDKQQNLKFLQLLKKEIQKAKKTQQQTQNILKFGQRFACTCQAQLPTIGAYLGGLASQQVIKALTNKYTPIKQFFTFHINELLQKFPETQQQYNQKHIKQNQIFASLKIVIGRQNATKIQKMKTMIIGAGAIGCQLLKNFAMINMGSQGSITVTDPDHIQTSNLTRQFLFRQKHVKKPKSATAAATLVQMNPLLKSHISARLDKVCQQTEDIYSDEFYEEQNIVANALDNVRARVYVDKRCVHNKKPLFQSGTLGPKGHVQVIIPDKTQNYGNQNDPAQQNQIPHCTLKMFPEETIHCIQWSRDIFGKVFTLNPKALKKVIETKDTNSVQGQQRETVAKMIQHKPLNFDDCVAQAVRKFYRYFRNNVRQLLHTYPLDMKTKEGKLFWQLPKRPPKQISEINFADEIHQTFISSYSVNLAKVYNLPYPKNFRKPEGKEQIMNIAKNVKVENFIPSEEQSAKLQKMNEAENNKQQKMMQEQPPLPAKEVELKLSSDIIESKITPDEFQKDQDSNGHIDLIYSMSNLRCRNYGLSQCKWIQAKLKAGKIMAALSTTTSVVAALQTLQIIKYMTESTLWRNAFANLAVPLIQISQPGQAPKHKVGQTQFTVWDVWSFKCSTLKDVLMQLKQKHKVEGYNVSTSQGKPVFWQAMYVGKQQAKENILNKPLKQMFSDKIVELNILMRDIEQIDGVKKVYQDVPRIRIQII